MQLCSRMLVGQDVCGGLTPLHSLENVSTQQDCVLPHKRPTYSNYVTQSSRLETFSSWPVQLSQTPSELASAGFFYTGCGDKVICFSGGCGLEMWEPGDKPMVEHPKWYPNCSFVRMTGSQPAQTQLIHIQVKDGENKEENGEGEEDKEEESQQ